jgi:Asp-tRNA(Asn)/Glu-tRNA(Gln) amidotransferase A subunit family amidase
MTRQDWFRTALLAPVVALPPLAIHAAPPKPVAFDIQETTIAQTEEAIRTHQITCRQLVEIYLARIRAYDQTLRPGQAGHLNAVVTLNPDALADADRLDAEFARTHKLRPLHGIVVMVKDNYDTKGLQTTGGSLALKWFLPSEDAFMVKKLREAGAIVIAKSNMAEWAFSPVLTESSIAGVTRNPYALDRVPAGSSGGTGASVAANLAEVGLGTDTGDSIRGPASHNGLVGIRPTIGLTSRDGIIPLSFTADVGGPLARTVADAAAILAAVQGYDPADPITKLSEGKVPADYSASFDKNGLKGARIGVVRSYFETVTTDPQIKALTEQAIADLKAQGATIVDNFALPEQERGGQGGGGGGGARNPNCGFEHDLNVYLATHGQNAPYHSLQEIIDSGLYLGSIADRLKRNTPVGAAAPRPNAGGPAGIAAPTPPAAAVATVPTEPPPPCPDTYHDPRKMKYRDALLASMDAQHLDALVYPTWSNPPRKVGDLKSPGGDNSQIVSPTTGFPGITVPMGFTHADGDDMLPAGLTFVGRSFSEAQLIKLAYAYEQATLHRRPPALFGPLP